MKYINRLTNGKMIKNWLGHDFINLVMSKKFIIINGYGNAINRAVTYQFTALDNEHLLGNL